MVPSGKEERVLVVDVGNTTTTCAVFLAERVVRTAIVPTETLKHRAEQLLRPFADAYPEIREAVLCSVVPAVSDQLRHMLPAWLSGNVLEISASLRLPFVLHYDPPESFGADRIAFCALGRKLAVDRALIALDVGTAITFDVLGRSGDYLGGFIMPGIDLMARSLHECTAQLPLVAIQPPEELLGRSTAASVRNGIFWGSIAQVEGLSSRILRTLRERGEGEAVVIATGGNASWVVRELAVPVLLVDHAVAAGANYLYRLNSSG